MSKSTSLQVKAFLRMLPTPRVLIIDPDYPRDSNLYGDVFVHTRLKAYPESWQIQVVGFNNQLKEPCQYTWDGISVYLSRIADDIKNKIREARPDVILVHFIQHEMMETLLEQNKPLVIFFHGYESTSWKRRLYNYTSPGAIPYLIKYIRGNRHQLKKLREFIDKVNQRPDVQFVFVSKWLQQACETDLKIRINHGNVIHNAIDTKRFPFVLKSPDLRKKILSIRSFNARNYANDILVEAILTLSKKSYFNELSFSIYGEGYLFESLTGKIKHFQNVKLYNHFVPNEKIPAIHKDHGIFFCFSRLDSQGVSMGEAMSSGLVTVTSRVAAIPEFVEEGRSGFLTENMEDIVQCMDTLYQEPIVFNTVSEQGSKAIEEKCGLSRIIPMEEKLISQLINR